jgi:DNA-binding response OmpR family regulator
VFTVLGRDDDKRIVKENGWDGYFVKPFTTADLVAEVERHISRSLTNVTDHYLSTLIAYELQ